MINYQLCFFVLRMVIKLSRKSNSACESPSALASERRIFDGEGESPMVQVSEAEQGGGNSIGSGRFWGQFSCHFLVDFWATFWDAIQ